MKPPTEVQAATTISELLAELLGASPGEIEIQHVGETERYDYAISAKNRRYIAEYKGNSSTAAVVSAIDGLQRYLGSTATAGLPLLIVPYMGDVGRQLCDKAKMSWLDLCGNAKIVAPGLRIWIEGRPNQYSERGRPPNVFAPKSSRITRQLLLQPRQFQSQSELARQSGLGDGYVSKIVRRLEQHGYLNINEDGEVRPQDPNLLLDAWHEVYEFDHHRVIKGHVAARTGEELLQRVSKQLMGEKLRWAATGLSAAWLYTNFAAFRLATVYLSSMPTQQLLRQIEFSDEPKGANLWLVVPNDEGVFQGAKTQSGIPCVNEIQAYLDLKGHPERAKDAAIELRRSLLKWS